MPLFQTDIFKHTRDRHAFEIKQRIDLMLEILEDYIEIDSKDDAFALKVAVNSKQEIEIQYRFYGREGAVYGTMKQEDAGNMVVSLYFKATNMGIREKYRVKYVRNELGLMNV